MPDPGRQHRSRGGYGVDAPGVPLGLASAGLILAVSAFAVLAFGGWRAPAGMMLFSSVSLFTSTGIYLHTTWRGKFRVWTELLDDLDLHGDEEVLDLGCGRGAVLIAAAHRLPQGRGTGVDLWRSVDQSGNTPDSTRANAGDVSDRIDLHTADLTALPFPDHSFDVVLSALAIHNIATAGQRLKAIDEAARLLRPNGRLVLVDILHTTDYARRLTDLGLSDVQHRPLGWRYWYGGPWMATRLVTATAPDKERT